MTTYSMTDLRRLFYGGGSQAEYDFLVAANAQGKTAASLLALSGADWMRHVFLDQSTMTNTNWATIQADASQRYGFYRQSTGAQHAQISFSLVFDAGTYAMDVLGPKSNEYGIATLAIDGVDVTFADLYNATLVFNQTTTAVFIVPTSGKKVVTLTMKTKNASNVSANYFGVITRLTFRRTA